MFVEVPEQTRQFHGRRNPSDRLFAINQALSNPNLPPKRMERLKLQKVKLEALNSEVSPVVASSAPEAVPLVPLRGPAARLLAIEQILAQPDLHPRRVEKLQEKKKQNLKKSFVVVTSTTLQHLKLFPLLLVVVDLKLVWL